MVKQRSISKLLLEQVRQDWEFIATFGVGIFVLLAELLAPAGAKLGLRAAALLMLVAGFGFFLHSRYRSSRLLFADKPVPLVFSVGVPRPEAERAVEMLQAAVSALTGFKAFRQVEEHFNVHYKDMLAHLPTKLPPEPDAWLAFLSDGQHDVRKTLDDVPGDRTYHVAVQGPVSLALGLGAILGTKHPVVAYHFQGGRYQPVLDLRDNSRRIKERLPADGPLRFLDISYPRALTQDTALVLAMGSRDPVHAVRQHVASWTPQPPELVEVKNTYQGNLKLEDWTPVVQELVSVFNHLQSAGVQRIHLFHDMPVPLALGLGMALGTLPPVTVYNWERGEQRYYPVLELHRLRSLL